MSTQIQWYDDDKTIIHVMLAESDLWDNYPMMRETVVEMLAQVSHTVDFIVDLSNVNYISSGALTIARKLRQQRLANEGTCAIFGSSPMVKALYRSFTLAFPYSVTQYHLVNTESDARELLNSLREKRSISDTLQD